MLRLLMLLALLLCFPAQEALAHFGLIIPSKSMLMGKPEPVSVEIAFAHPFAASGMPMQKPIEAFIANGEKENGLKKSPLNLQQISYLGQPAFKAVIKPDRPGVYQLAAIPEPYFEESEDCFIIHYAKTIIAAFGDEEGWDIPLGLPVEIIPLTRPFGNYAGNSFSATVLKDGKPIANADVEVEYLNNPPTHKAPNAYFETQIVKTDQNGTFTFAVPWAGWWGFAALTEGDQKIERNGQPKSVELGGIIWVNFSKPELAK